MDQLPSSTDRRDYEKLADRVPAGSHEIWTADDERFMRHALDLARKASAAGEIPVGALVISNGEIAGVGWNRPISSRDPTWHAEMEALRCAAQRIGNYRLTGTTLYVTLEPCVMCAGAVLAARVERLVFAARDIRFGAVRSKFRLADSDLLNHRAQIDEGLFAAEAGELLASFFRERRS